MIEEVPQPHPERSRPSASRLSFVGLLPVASAVVLGMIVRGRPPWIDLRFHAFVLAHRGSADVAFARAVTQAGSTAVVWPLLGVATVLFLLAPGERWWRSLLFLAATGSGIGTGLLVGMLVRRSRPAALGWASHAGG